MKTREDGKGGMRYRVPFERVTVTIEVVGLDVVELSVSLDDSELEGVLV